MTLKTDKKHLKARLLAMMVLRVVLAFAFLGITAWFQTREFNLAQRDFYPLYGMVVTVGLLTILYALLLNRLGNLRLFAYIQVTVDIALITALVYMTGGLASYLSTLYLLAVIGSAIILNKRGGFYAASVSSISYGVLVDLDFYGFLPGWLKVIGAEVSPASQDVLTMLATNILAFITVAYLTGYLTEKMARVESELVDKESDFERLELLNKQIIENITSGIMTLDENSRITSFNAAAAQVTGYLFDEVYRKDVEEVFPGMLRAAGEAASSGMRLEKVFRKKDGTGMCLGFTVSGARGGDVSKIVIFQDLTHLKAMEEQLRRDEMLKALGGLSVGIAHEIRNPLAAISGSIQVLNGELDLEKDNSRLMEIVLRETDRLNTLITDFLLFARPAQEKREVADLAGIIKETLEIFRNAPEASKIRVASSIEEGIFIDCDARQIGQVFWNLFLNAAHAMRGEGELRVDATRLSATEAVDSGEAVGASKGHGFMAEIKVADNGKGIPPADMARIFDPFFSTKDSGTGLGLAIVHRIIESHGGSITVESAPGEGTVFRTLLPVAAAAVPA